MANDRLRAAVSKAGLTTEQVARKSDVDPKTVQKWLAGRVPHPRHRWAVAELVNEDEEFLWPDARRRPPDGLGAAAEVVASFPRRADVDNNRWRKLIDQGEHQIDILGYTLFFLPQQIPDLVDSLIDKCERGCRVRMVLADPDCEQVRLRDEEEAEPITLVARIQTSLRAYEPLLACGNAEIRYQTAPLYNSVYRFDDEMFMTPHLYATPGHAAPLFHLRRLGPNGMFSRFASHFEGIWADSKPIGQDQARKPARAGR
jgi:transcriptional regulator with XRE-family HTH domain